MPKNQQICQEVPFFNKEVTFPLTINNKGNYILTERDFYAELNEYLEVWLEDNRKLTSKKYNELIAQFNQSTISEDISFINIDKIEETEININLESQLDFIQKNQIAPESPIIARKTINILGPLYASPNDNLDNSSNYLLEDDSYQIFRYLKSNGELIFEGYVQLFKDCGDMLYIYDKDTENLTIELIFDKDQQKSIICLKQSTKTQFNIHHPKRPKPIEGVLFYTNGQTKYKGTIVDKKPHGLGTEFHPNGQLRYSGNWVYGKIDGQFVYITSKSGNIEFEGGMKNGAKNGYGKEYYPNGVLKYSGLLIHNKLNGDDIEYFYGNGNKKYVGSYQNGNMHGNGKYYHMNGELFYEGEFRNNEVNCVKAVLRNNKGYIVYRGKIVSGISKFDSSWRIWVDK